MSQGEVSYEGIREFAHTHGYSMVVAGQTWYLFLRSLDDMELPPSEVTLQVLVDFCVPLRQRRTRPDGFRGMSGDLLVEWCDYLLS